jgi:hypothetical protein
MEVSDPHNPAAACTDILQSINCHLEVSAVSTAGSFKRCLQQAGDLQLLKQLASLPATQAHFYFLAWDEDSLRAICM